MALGSLIIKQNLNCSDDETLEQIRENPYLQYFIGLREYTSVAPFTSQSMTEFRKRFSEDDILELVNNLIIDGKKEDDMTKSEGDKCVTIDGKDDNDDDKNGESSNNSSGTVSDRDNIQQEDKVPLKPNCGSLAIDATCSPADIEFPQDINLLNKAREKTEIFIDELHKTSTTKTKNNNAKWSTNISFEYEEATSDNSITNKPVVYTSPIGNLPRPYKVDYSFEGWYTGENGSGTEYTNATTYLASSNITLYAKWVEGTDKSYFTTTISGCYVNITGLTASGKLLNKIVIPNVINNSLLTTIGNYAFMNCTNITELVIPNSASIIGYGIASGCTSLVKLSTPLKESYANNTSSYIRYFFFNGSNLNYLLPVYSETLPVASLKEVVITGNMTKLTDNACYRLENVTKITIPSTVTEIGNLAFYNCSALEELIIPTNATSIARGALTGCTGLESLVVPLQGTYDPDTCSYTKYLFGGTSYSSAITLPNLKNITINGSDTSGCA